MSELDKIRKWIVEKEVEVRKIERLIFFAKETIESEISKEWIKERRKKQPQLDYTQGYMRGRKGIEYKKLTCYSQNFLRGWKSGMKKFEQLNKRKQNGISK